MCQRKNTEEDNRQLETIATQAANWLTTQVPECDVITTQAGKDGIILLTGVKNPGIATYAVLKAFVLEQDGGTFSSKKHMMEKHRFLMDLQHMASARKTIR